MRCLPSLSHALHSCGGVGGDASDDREHPNVQATNYFSPT